MTVAAHRVHLRYGKFASAAALYVDPDAVEGETLVTQVEGNKAMSYNNYSDADATLDMPFII